MRGNAGFLLLLLLAVGCSWFVRSQAFRYDDIDRPARPADHAIPVIDDTTSISRPYIVIGMVQADAGEVEGIGDREMREALRKEARRMGGDGLVNLRRVPSIYSVGEHRVDSDVRDLADLRDRMKYRWVAEVITYDLPTEAPASLQPGETAPQLP